MAATDPGVNPPDRPSRWRWALSLRGLMLLVLVVGGLLVGHLLRLWPWVTIGFRWKKAERWRAGIFPIPDERGK